MLTIENTDSDLKVHALHYANELLVRVRLSFQKKLVQNRSTYRNNTKKNVWEKSNDAYSLSIRVHTTINHISIFTFLCFLRQYQRQRNCFLSERELRKALRETLTRAAWSAHGNFWLVRSEHSHASYPGLFFRPPGFSPNMGREESRVQGLDYNQACSVKMLVRIVGWSEFECVSCFYWAIPIKYFVPIARPTHFLEK